MPKRSEGISSATRRREPLFGKKPASRIPYSFLVLAALIILFALIPPVTSWDADFDPAASPVLPTSFPTRTQVPHPTDVHGGRIIFTCTRGDYNQLCMINADGTGLEQITDHNANDYYPILSPEGNSVAFASYVDGSFDLFMMILSNSKLFRITEQIGNAFSPTFSPDGNRIAFLNRVGDSPISLWMVAITGRDAHQIYSGAKDIVAAAWSPLGDEIAFAMSVENDFSYQLFTLSPDNPSRSPRRITNSMDDIGGSLDWSPDGKYLLFYAGPVSGRNIFRLDVASGEILQLTFGGNNAAAAYSPDGQYIVYNSLRNNNQADLYIMRADGHSTRQLTDHPEPDWQPHWAP